MDSPLSNRPDLDIALVFHHSHIDLTIPPIVPLIIKSHKQHRHRQLMTILIFDLIDPQNHPPMGGMSLQIINLERELKSQRFQEKWKSLHRFQNKINSNITVLLKTDSSPPLGGGEVGGWGWGVVILHIRADMTYVRDIGISRFSANTLICMCVL